MTEAEVLKRKILLKKQSIPLIQSEIVDLQIRLALNVLKDRLETQIGDGFDPVVSRRLDAIQILLEQ